jgi:hypothetical protein
MLMMLPLFIFFNQDHLVKGTHFIVMTFAKFGLTVHLGSHGMKSKMEAMHIPGKQDVLSDPSDTADYIVISDGDNSKFVSYCSCFKYLGSFLTQEACNVDYDIEAWLTAASQMFSMMKKVLCDKSISQDVQQNWHGIECSSLWLSIGHFISDTKTCWEYFTQNACEGCLESPSC